jgi:hypothetical protein
MPALQSPEDLNQYPEWLERVRHRSEP